MKLTDITKRIASLQRAAEKRQKNTTDEALQQWLHGYLQGLDAVADIIKKEQEIERTEQRLEKLKSDKHDEPEPDWSQAPDAQQKAAATPANTNAATSTFTPVTSPQKAA